MSITKAEANARLDGITTPEELRLLIAEIDTTGRGSQTLFYSGDLLDGTRAIHAARRAAETNAAIRIVDFTEAGLFLDVETNPAFTQKLEQFFGPLDEENRLAREFLFGIDQPDGSRTPSGVWDDVSRRFTAGAVGEVRIMAPLARAAGIFGTTELEALLANPNVTLVEGYSRADLVRMADQAMAFDSLTATSLVNSHASNLSSTNTAHFLQLTPEASIAALRADGAVKLNSLDEALDNFDPVRKAQLLRGIDALQVGAVQASDAGVPRLLNRLGLVGGFLGFFVASHASAAEHEAGNPTRAVEIMEEWAAESAGSEIGAIAGSAITALAITAVAAAGVTLAAPLAGALVVGGALVGGFFGGEGGLQFYELMHDRDNNGKRDIIDKLSNLFLGATSTITTPLPLDLNGDKYTIDASLTREEMVGNARLSQAWRYALRELNSFVVKDIDHSRFNTDGSLDLVDPVTGLGNMSELYLADRAAMLMWKMRYEELGARDDDDTPRDGSKPYNENWNTSEIDGNWDFVDLTQRLPGGAPLQLSIDGNGISLHDHQIVFGRQGNDTIEGEGDSDHLYGGGGEDGLSGLDGNDHLEGGAGNDRLDGGSGHDVLLGGTGVDDLVGGAGNDRLEGGASWDNYIFRAGDGDDAIFDADGRNTGEITLRGAGDTSLSGAWDFDFSTGRWTAAHAPGVTLEKLPLQSGPGVPPAPTPRQLGQASLRVNYTGGSVVVEGFQFDLLQGENFLGIELRDGLRAQFVGGSGSSTTLREGTARAIEIALANAAQAGDVVRLSLPSLSDQFFLLDSATELPFVDGMAVITLAEGQTDIRLGLIHRGDVDADASVSLTAAFVPSGATDPTAQDILSIELDALDELTPNPGTTITLDPADAVIVGTPQGPHASWGAGVPPGVGTASPERFIVPEGFAITSVDLGLGGDDVVQGASSADGIASKDERYLEELFGYHPLIYDEAYELVASEALTSRLHHTRQVLLGAGDDGFSGGFDHYAVEGADGSDLIIARGGDDRLEGGAGNDVISAGSGADTLLGGDGNDILYGGGGTVQTGYFVYGGSGYFEVAFDTSDHLEGGAGDDRVLGGYGDDFAQGDAGADDLYGGQGNDVLLGGSDADRLYGDGNAATVQQDASDTTSTLTWWAGDVAAAEHGADFLDGNDGHDVLWGQGGADTLFGGADNDELHGDDLVVTLDASFHGNDYLNGEAGNDTLLGGSGNDILIGESGNDLLIGDGDGIAAAVGGNDWLEGGDGDDELQGNGGDDTLLGGQGVDVLLGDDGDDWLDGDVGADQLQGGAGQDVLIGGAGDDMLDGQAGDDALFGGDGADYLIGSAGHDVLAGGAGDDTYEINDADAAVIEVTGEGYDTVIATVDMTTPYGVEQLILSGAALAVSGNEENNIVAGNALDNALFGRGGDDTLHGNDGNDALSGEAGEDTLVGGTGSDALDGGYGDDWMDGAAGADAMSGGFGDDVYIVDDAGDTVNEAQFAGSDTVRSSISYTLAADVEELELTGSADLDGTGNADANRLFGNAGNNHLVGLAGNDELAGSAGDDTLDGGADSDTLQGDAGNDVYVYGLGYGSDVVNDAGTSADIDTLRLTGLAPGDVTLRRQGNDLLVELNASSEETRIVDHFVGAANAIERIEFGSGDIWDEAAIAAAVQTDFVGTPGDDVISGTAGADTMVGLAGNDIYEVNHAGDVTVEEAGGGVDQVNSTTSHTLGAHVENLTLTGAGALNGTGNAGANLLAGNAEANVLDGGAGDDTLIGGGGNDTYIGGSGNDTLTSSSTASNDLYHFAPGEGMDAITDGGGDDRVFLAAGITPAGVGLYRRGTDLEIRISAGQVITVTGMYTLAGAVVTASAIELIEFAEGTIWNAADIASRLQVEGGDDDTLVGTDGSDTLDGGAGNDTLYGRGGDDVLIGGPGNDVLYDDDPLGFPNTDTLIGGSGNDTYYVNSAADVIIENPEEGVDEVNAAGTNYTLPANVEHLSLSLPGFFLEGWTGIGNELNNRITGTFKNDILQGEAGDDLLEGNDGSDRLIGGAGSDQLIGGAGNDTYVVDANDVIVEQSAGGIDTVESDISYIVPTNVENIVLTGAADVSAVGDGSNNRLVGNAGINWLVGNGGNDQLVAVGGNDTLEGGTGDDVYFVDDTSVVIVDAADEGIDTVVTSVESTLGANTENMVINGPGNFTVRGNSGNNIFTFITSPAQGGHVGATAFGEAGDDFYVYNTGTEYWLTTLDISSPYHLNEAVSEGIDTFRTNVSRVRLPDHIENLTIDSLPINGIFYGTDPSEAKPKYFGNASDNVLDLSNAANGSLSQYFLRLVGGFEIDGGAGADRMIGTDLNDVYYVDNVGDIVDEWSASSDSIDRVVSSVDFALSNNVENLELVGSQSIAGTGNSLDNVIVGNSAANILTGGLGNDTYVIGLTDSVQELAGEGNDTVIIDAQQQPVSGMTFRVSDYANVENLRVTGFTGLGGVTLLGDANANVVAGSRGNDWIEGGAGDDQLEGEVGNDQLIGGEGSDVLRGGVGNDTLISGVAGSTADLLDGGAGNDLLSSDGSGATFVVRRDDGVDVIENHAASGSAAGVLSFTGSAVTASNVRLTRGIGDEANDLIITIVGSAGSIAVKNHFLSSGVERADGISSIVFTDSTSWDRSAIDANTSLPAVPTDGDDVLEGSSGDDTIDALAGNDIVRGRAGNDTLLGSAGNDELYGDAGNDTIDGGLGSDAMEGGLGDDVFFIDDAGDQLLEQPDYTYWDGVTIIEPGGTDTVHSSISYTLSAAIENLVLAGAADLNATGSYLNNVLVGNAGANRLDGLGGADDMSGSDGNDTYIVDVAGDIVHELAGGGTDTVETDITYTLGAEVENLTLTGSASLNGTGNESSNVLRGNSGHNRLDGLGGSDTFEGNGGNDLLISQGQGSVFLFGRNDGHDVALNQAAAGEALGELQLRAGIVEDDLEVLRGVEPNNDLTIVIKNTNDRIVIQSHFTVTAGERRDGISSLRFADGTTWMRTEIDARAVTGGIGGGGDPGMPPTTETYATGTSLNDTLYGNHYNNYIDALAGNDTVSGLEGDDWLTGGAGSDWLYGNDGRDWLDGGDGNDFLVGGAGFNTMYGGAGDDWFFVDSFDDYVGEFLNAGTDRVQASVSWGLAANIENLTLTGAAPLDGVGNSLNNSITGNAANNRLTGGAGDDTLFGGNGNDQLDGGDGQDSLRGEAGDDTLISGARGVMGDFMVGGIGNDRLISDGSGATFSFLRGDGQDVIENHAASLSASGTLSFFSAGINSTEVTLVRGLGARSNDLIIRVNGSTDSITVTDHFSTDGGAQRPHGLSGISFADTFWMRHTIDANTGEGEGFGGGMSLGMLPSVDGDDFVSLRRGFNRSSASKFALLGSSKNAQIASLSPLLAPLLDDSDAQSITPETTMQPNLDNLLSFWNARTNQRKSWWLSEASVSNKIEVAVGSEGAMAGGATRGIARLSPPSDFDEEPRMVGAARPVATMRDITGDSAVWAVQRPVARTVASDDAGQAADTELARIQPHTRIVPWWDAWGEKGSSVSLVGATWEVVHQKLATQLAETGSNDAGVGVSASSLSGTSVTTGMPQMFEQAPVVDHVQVVAGRLRHM